MALPLLPPLNLLTESFSHSGCCSIEPQNRVSLSEHVTLLILSGFSHFVCFFFLETVSCRVAVIFVDKQLEATQRCGCPRACGFIASMACRIPQPLVWNLVFPQRVFLCRQFSVKTQHSQEMPHYNNTWDRQRAAGKSGSKTTTEEKLSFRWCGPQFHCYPTGKSTSR